MLCSSSTINSVGMTVLLGRGRVGTAGARRRRLGAPRPRRQDDGEAGAAAVAGRPIGRDDGAAVLLDDPLRDAQAQPRAKWLAARERLEQVALSLGRDPFAGVAHVQADRV